MEGQHQMLESPLHPTRIGKTVKYVAEHGQNSKSFRLDSINIYTSVIVFFLLYSINFP